ncbi:SET domain-containing protein [Lacinutrix sp. Bg11-31]|uniref:SET domain-containing protein n=1 Tax=Lacinutrix sp. Bg11-31 TaxID=2057808 RepID=UPI001E3B318A|nr:SET domain-containing protein [Lacinutrix sp. Bg11-31]
MKVADPEKNYIDANTIEASEEDYLYIKTSQIQNAGNGLFTAIDIFKNEIITLFKGEILDAKEAEERAKQNSDRYFINLLDGTIMDSMHTNCFAKYANDAINSDFKKNAEITLDANDNVCLKAIKKIKSGEEIFCSYGKRYWKKHS